MRPLGIAFDIDGVLIKGKKVLPQAIRAIKRIKAEQVPFVLMTNGGGTTEQNKAAELSGLLQTEITPAQMILAHTPMASLSSKYSTDDSEAVLILGKDGCKDAALAYGFKHPILSEEILTTCADIWPFRAPLEGYKPVSNLDRKIGAILSFHDSKDWGRDIQIVCDLMRSGGNLRAVIGTRTPNCKLHVFQTDPKTSAERGSTRITPPEHQLPLYFSNGDFVWSNNLPLSRFAQGSFRNALAGTYQQLSGKKLHYTMYGKPHKSTYDFAKRAIDENAFLNHGSTAKVVERTYFGIGDNPESDIEGANRNGWTSVLVKTGVYEGGDHAAKILVEDVEEAVDVILTAK
ncbi:Haloacid dehalogenase-like hydrolase domain-containing 5 [Podochytrium sp. JEL0797]|nr:Haloacid dehalogenase-like hydrolase domain-containing 5 [Podochytrium sp. JEL0797]